ncbi:MAG TPA: hypothetical protein VGA67_00900 [Candidatus Dojkabacteria bacterium]|jgi:endoglucanase
MDYKNLEKLIFSHAVTSDTSRVKETVKSLLKELDVEFFEDGFGSIVFGNIAGEVMLTAHLDEVGFQITKINDDGTLQFLPVGDVHPNTLNNKVVYVQAGDDQIQGAVFSSNLLRENNIDNFSDLFIDLGTKTKLETENLGIKAGQTGTFKKEFFRQNGNIFATGIDDKVSIFAILEILKKDKTFLDKSFVAFHTDEEMQNHSANSLTVQFKPEFAIILDYFPAHQKAGSNDVFDGVGNGAILFYRGGNHIIHEDLRNRLDPLEISKGFVSPTTMNSLEPQNYENNGRTKAVNLNIPAHGYHSGIYSVREKDVENFIESIQKVVSALL